MTDLNVLRPITQRLTSTPVKELPHIAYFLASSIATCSQALQATAVHATSRSNDDVVLVHKLKTRLSSLLQDRSPEGRFTAVVLVKAVVEAGGREVLSSSEPWVRGLLAVLAKGDSASTKKLCLIAITRIFSLTLQYPTLVREITTPLLPTFITACLNLIKPKIVRTDDGTINNLSPFLELVFRSISELLPHHPTVFRPFAARLNAIALSLLGDASAPRVVTDVASNVIATLHFSASRNEAGVEWNQFCKSIVLSCHITADQVFRSVLEDWEPSEQVVTSGSATKFYGSKVQARDPDALGLPTWVGVHDGTQRLVRLLRLLMKLLSCRTAQPISCPIGSIIDLTARLTAVTAIADSKTSQFSMRLNREIGRDEREELWMDLPIVHVTTLDLLSVIIVSFADSALSIARIVLDQMTNVFEAEQRNEDLRVAAYGLTKQLLSLVGFSLARSDVELLTLLIRRCCAELFPQTGPENVPVNASTTKVNGYRSNGPTPVDADSFANHERDSLRSYPFGNQTAVYIAAFRLLPCFLCNLPAVAVPHSLRTDIDRTAIIVQNQKALLVSVLNPPQANNGQRAPPSIMPFLARASSGDVDIEGLLRPRMPLIRNGKTHTIAYGDMSEGEISDDSPAADNAEGLGDKQITGLPEGPDLLDRLEHSLANSPVDTKHDIDGITVKQTSVYTFESSASQDLVEPTTKRNLAAMDDKEAEQDLETGAPSRPGSHLAAGPQLTNVNKRRRLENDAGVLSSDNRSNETPNEAAGLHEAEIQVAEGNSSIHDSTQDQPNEERDMRSNTGTFNQSAALGKGDDDESDFEIPEIFDSSSEDDEGVVD